MGEYLKLKKSNCKNCYKCIRNCPVKSIRFSDNQANIIPEDCILCGHCFLACPQNAKEIRNDVDKAKELLAGTAPVFASIAPSFAANYPGVSIGGMEQALKKLGFAGAEETAVGATMVKEQYEALLSAGEQNVVISSCCHTVNLLIQKYYPEAIPFLAPVLSPMLAHCRNLKTQHPGAKTVFIGPCLSKKDEGEQSQEVDCVLTFEELTDWLQEEKIPFEKTESEPQPFLARLFPTAGGILRTMTRQEGYTYLAIDGIEACMQALKDVLNGNLHNCFIELSACEGSCMEGPGMDNRHRTPVRDYIAISQYAGNENLHLPENTVKELQKTFPSLQKRQVILPDSAIEEVLREMGKTRPEDELNCGSCGYNTCREKARAVLEGKATITMCLPYLKEKAESFSNTIIQNTPNAILVVNELLEVQLVNRAACGLLHVSGAHEIMGDQVVRVLDPAPFLDALDKNRNLYNKKVFLAEYGKYIDQTVIYDRNYHIIICIMRDVTEETVQQESRQELNRKTIEVTDKVIEKQMRTVQEIASLLGETTAETKVALTKLKESLHDG